MSLPVLVASTLLLFLSLPITLSTPFDGNTVSVTTLLPTGYCLSSGQGYLVAITGNNTQCECVYVAAPTYHTPIYGCDGGATAACSQTGYDSSGPVAHCTTCVGDACGVRVSTETRFQAYCTKNDPYEGYLGTPVLYSTGISCSCVVPDPPVTNQGLCNTPTNSYASCITTITRTASGSESDKSACSFTCLSGYQTSSDGNSCVITCPANSFAAGSLCTLCGSNMSSPSGSTSKQQCTCIAGYQTSLDGSRCVLPCPANTFGEDICTACSPFSSSPVGSMQGTQCACNTGYTSSGRLQNQTPNCACTPGTNPIGINGSSCGQCPPTSLYNTQRGACFCYSTDGSVGSYYSPATNQCLCHGATFHDPTTGICHQCGTGTDPTATGCVCVNSTYILDANNNCSPRCPANTFGTDSCTPCGGNMESPIGSTSMDQCTCVPGAYPYDTEFNVCPCNGADYYSFGINGDCTACPANITQPTGTNTGTCECPGMQTFDTSSGTCSCNYPDNCECRLGSTLTYTTSYNPSTNTMQAQPPSCVCDSTAVYIYGTGCITCPFGSWISSEDPSGDGAMYNPVESCVCYDQTATFVYPPNECRCPNGLVLDSGGMCNNCPENTYSVYDDYGTMNCPACGSNLISPAGSTDISQCTVPVVIATTTTTTTMLVTTSAAKTTTTTVTTSKSVLSSVTSSANIPTTNASSTIGGSISSAASTASASSKSTSNVPATSVAPSATSAKTTTSATIGSSISPSKSTTTNILTSLYQSPTFAATTNAQVTSSSSAFSSTVKLPTTGVTTSGSSSSSWASTATSTSQLSTASVVGVPSSTLISSSSSSASSLRSTNSVATSTKSITTFDQSTTSSAKSSTTVKASGSASASASAGLSTCIAGFGIKIGAAVCSACTAGTYSVSGNSAPCQVPAAGYYALSGLLRTCPSPSSVATCSPTTGVAVTCRATYALSLAGTCTLCPAGQYANNGTCAACLAPQSLTCDAATGLLALTCLPGLIHKAGVCTSCSGATYPKTTVFCAACPDIRATTCDADGTTITCKPGYANIAGTCSRCSAGTYALNSTCIACVSSTIATCDPVTGAINTCVTGLIRKSGACIPCTGATYAATPLSCHACLDVRSTSCDANGASLTCKTGWANMNGTCAQCTVGYASNSTCIPCISATAASCDPVSGVTLTCQPGLLRQSGACIPCAAGTYLKEPLFCAACLDAHASTCDSTTGLAITCKNGWAVSGTVCVRGTSSSQSIFNGASTSRSSTTTKSQTQTLSPSPVGTTSPSTSTGTTRTSISLATPNQKL